MAARQTDGIGYFAAFFHADDLVGSWTSHPDAALFVQTNSVRSNAFQVGKGAAAGEIAIRGYGECRQPGCKSFCNDQCLAVRSNHDSVREENILGSYSDISIRSHAKEHAGTRRLALVQIKAERSDVAAALAVCHHVIDRIRRERTEVCNGAESMAVVFEQTPVAHRNHAQRTIWQPAQPGWQAGNVYDFRRHSFRRKPPDNTIMHVREIKRAIMPARPFRKGQSIENSLRCHQLGKCSIRTCLAWFTAKDANGAKVPAGSIA